MYHIYKSSVMLGQAMTIELSRSIINYERKGCIMKIEDQPPQMKKREKELHVKGEKHLMVVAYKVNLKEENLNSR